MKQATYNQDNKIYEYIYIKATLRLHTRIIKIVFNEYIYQSLLRDNDIGSQWIMNIKHLYAKVRDSH